MGQNHSELPPVEGKNWSEHFFPWSEVKHNPLFFKTPLSTYVEPGWPYRIPNTTWMSPDFRIDEQPFVLFPANKESRYLEEDRYYRITPFYRQILGNAGWWRYRKDEHPQMLGCFCTTVFKRDIVLGTCAILTTKHILTTASSTHMVLRRYGQKSTLENILGAWYDNNEDSANSSYYMTPCRIHFHPKWVPPDQTNRSHPLPVSYDLSVWTATFRFKKDVVVCRRGSSSRRQKSSSTPRPGGLVMITGTQMVMDIQRNPHFAIRYTVKTRRGHINPCPKVEWGWFHCIQGYQWGKLGVDSGAGLTRHDEGTTLLYDGLVGMNAFSMKLRSKQMVNYFTVLDRHSVLNFLYDAYMGKIPYAYLDGRFENTKWRSPKVRGYYWIRNLYPAPATWTNYNPINYVSVW